MAMNKQLMTLALLVAILPMAVSFTNAQSTQNKSTQKKADQKKTAQDSAGQKSAAQNSAAQNSAEQNETQSVEDEAQIRKSMLLGDLSALDNDAVNLNSSLARAVVKTEIADVVWNLDKQWARQLLKDAFELALPDKETRRKLQKVKKGDNPLEPTTETIPQMLVRSKVLAVARRDPAFADELAKMAKEEMGELEEVHAYSSSAYAAFQANDIKQATEYTRKIFDTDLSQGSAGGAIASIAVLNRDEADKLILEYIQKLRGFPINSDNALRIFSGLRMAVFPPPLSIFQRKKIPVAGKEAMRAYSGFLIESLLNLESREPGAATRLNSFIPPQIWLFISQQAPELVNSYMKLEAVSGIPKQSDGLQPSSLEERRKAQYETLVRNARTNKSQVEIEDALKMSLGRGDYETCRELIDKLPAGDLRSKYSEDVNMREAISLLEKKDFDGAARIAGKLESVASLTQVYPQMIKFCVDKEDIQCVNSLAAELTRKLEKKAESPKAALTLSRVAATVAAKDQTMAMELLRQAVSSANAIDVKRTDQNPHRVEFDNKSFELLALNHESEMFQMAKSLDSRFYSYLALAAIYRGKAKALLKKTSRGH